MSLLKKASIITTPTAYAEDYLYSIKPAKVTVNSVTSFANGTTYALTTFTSSANNVTSGIVSSAFGGCVSNAITLKKNQKVKVTFDYTQNSGNELRVVFSSSTNGAGTQISDPTTINATGTFNHTFTITSDSTGYLQLGTGNSGHSINFSALNVRAEVLSLADFDFDRNSTGTRVNEDYLIEDVPYNLNTYSEDFDQWTKINVTVSSDQILAPDGTLSADKLIATSGASNKVIFQGITAGTYTASVFAKKGEFEGLFIGTGTVGAFFNLNTYAYRTHYTSPPTSYQIESYGNGWYRYSITFTESSNNNLYIGPNDNVSTTLAITGDGSKGIYIWGAQLVKGDQPKDYLKTTDRLDIPRIDYTNGEPSILLEPSRTNDILNNTNLSQWLVGAGITVTSNAVNSPEGIQNADKIEKTSQNYTYVRQSIATGNVSVFSIFVKQGNYRYIGIRNNDSNHSVFDFETKSFVTSLSDHNLSVQQFPNGWFRLIDERTISTNTNVFRGIALTLANGTELSSNIPLNAFAYVWGGQLENNQTHATSLIHTSGSAVTRSADAANNAGNSDLINSTEGVLYAEIKALADDSEIDGISISDGTGTNRVVIFKWSASNTMRGRVTSGGTNTLNQNFTVSDITSFKKIAIKYKLNDFAIWLNGSEVFTDTSGAVPIGLNVLAFSSVGSGGADFYGNAKMVAVFKEALTDLELEKLTGYNNHELYMNYYNRLSYLGLVEEYNVESDINNYIL